MCHCSNFLLPPDNPNAASSSSSSVSLTYALVVLNQHLPKFAPLLWDHGNFFLQPQPQPFHLIYVFFVDALLLQHIYECALMEVPIVCMMKCLFSSLNLILPMFAPGFFSSTFLLLLFSTFRYWLYVYNNFVNHFSLCHSVVQSTKVYSLFPIFWSIVILVRERTCETPSLSLYSSSIYRNSKYIFNCLFCWFNWPMKTHLKTNIINKRHILVCFSNLGKFNRWRL